MIPVASTRKRAKSCAIIAALGEICELALFDSIPVLLPAFGLYLLATGSFALAVCGNRYSPGREPAARVIQEMETALRAFLHRTGGSNT